MCSHFNVSHAKFWCVSNQINPPAYNDNCIHPSKCPCPMFRPDPLYLLELLSADNQSM